MKLIAMKDASIGIVSTVMMMMPAWASYTPLAGYEPGSSVEQHARIDLDVKEMLEHLKNGDFGDALNIYSKGGHSGARAAIEVASWPSATTPDATYIKGTGAIVKQGLNAVGYIKSWDNKPVIDVTYTSLDCIVGGVKNPIISGCFNTTMDITITQAGGTDIVISAMDNNIVDVSNSYRTVAGFSTAAEKKMDGQQYYQAFKSYYASGSYGDDTVVEALKEPDQATNPLFYGKPSDMRVEVAKKGAVYMNIWMYVIREMEDAINDCTAGCITCNDDPVHAWDEAVAFYLGSLGADADKAGGDSGKLLYLLAEKRCKNFGTCDTESVDGNEAAVNVKIFEEFKKGKALLKSGKCTETIPVKTRIVELMTVPLLQGALRYAHIVAQSNKLQAASASSKAIAEGYIFARSILPRIAVCSSGDAELISRNQNLEAATAMGDGFDVVKAAYERNYQCLGVTCEDMGGLIDASTGEPYEDFMQCEDPTNFELQSESESQQFPQYALAIVIVCIVLLVISLGVFAFVTLRTKQNERQLREKLMNKAEEANELN